MLGPPVRRLRLTVHDAQTVRIAQRCHGYCTLCNICVCAFEDEVVATIRRQAERDCDERQAGLVNASRRKLRPARVPCIKAWIWVAPQSWRVGRRWFGVRAGQLPCIMHLRVPVGCRRGLLVLMCVYVAMCDCPVPRHDDERMCNVCDFINSCYVHLCWCWSVCRRWRVLVCQ